MKTPLNKNLLLHLLLLFHARKSGAGQTVEIAAMDFNNMTIWGYMGKNKNFYIPNIYFLNIRILCKYFGKPINTTIISKCFYTAKYAYARLFPGMVPYLH